MTQGTRQSQAIIGSAGVEGKAIGALPKDICCNSAISAAQIASPLVELEHQRSASGHIIANHATDNLRLLFQALATHHEHYKDVVNETFDHGYVGVFAERDLDGHRGQQTLPVRANGMNADDESVPMTLYRYPPRTEADQTSRLPFHVVRCEDQRTQQFGVFIAHMQNDLLIVNESVIARNLLAGPLPEFAVIQFEGRTLLWWGTRAGIQYAPSPVSQVGHSSGVESQLSTASKWREILDDGLAHHRRQKAKRSRKDSYRIKGHSSMIIDEVLVAIAAIWEALRNQESFQQPHIGYAFAGADVFNPGNFKAGLVGSGVVGRHYSKFIIPLFFPPSEKSTFRYYHELDANRKDKDKQVSGRYRRKAEPLGHFVLAIAERLSPEAREIRIEVRDSLPGAETKGTVHARAHELATCSGWAGHQAQSKVSTRQDAIQNAIPSSFVDVVVPKQPAESTSCGLSTILSAWALMLGIPIRQNLQRSGDHSDKEYLNTALEIVNLAVAGCMHSRTIQAWMNLYGYSEKQDADNPNDDVKFSVEATDMNMAKLEYVLVQQRSKDGK